MFPYFRDSLYVSFKDKIEYVNLEDSNATACQQYAGRLSHLRSSPPGEKLGDEWDLQNLQRACIWRTFVQRRPDIPDDAIVHFSDMDELPPAVLLANLKHCALKDGYVTKTPLNLEHTEIRYNLRMAHLGCAFHSAHGAVQHGAITWKGRKGVPQQKYKNGRIITGGVHLTYYGSLVQVMCKTVNHAEGGGIAVICPNKASRCPWHNGWCRTTRQGFDRASSLARDQPMAVLAPSQAGTANPRALPKGPPPDGVLRKCSVPEVLIKNKHRYPDFYGDKN